ncbi:arginase [Engelhardtia mirabilis]|uniref:Arginase n=1 Tax=Engelhardtia mirabilis TaxID=2528011 RepID=A0A518BJZ9_9BACT|nr:Arginase [Planctomycetes bacterium Pla133]QDV01599.1 Arginase [Planctomycetes bacterium Pla86]
MILDRKVSLIGAPLDLGGAVQGASLGPTAVRMAGLERRIRALDLDFEDLGDVPVAVPASGDPPEPSARFIREIALHCEALRDRVDETLTRGRFPLVIGGDHAVACGTISGVARNFRRRGQKVGLIWFDAHGDMNTPETSPSGNVHGMPLAACLGFGHRSLTELAGAAPMLDVSNCVLIGVHELDAREKEMIRKVGIRIYTMREIDMMGMQRVMEEALEIANDGTDGFHVSFDVDGCDVSIAPGTGTRVPGGTNFRESHLVLENVADSGRLVSLELTEVNPILDHANRTAELAVGLVESALGKLVL